MHRDIVVIGASAGGVEALVEVMGGLPDALDAALFVVLHMPATANSVLPAVLRRHTSLKVETASHGEAIQSRRVYVAPPDHHLEMRDGRIVSSRGPKENGHRPAVDTLFRSAARVYGPRVIGVILSGSLDDGAMGLRRIAVEGGIGVVQDPQDAPFPGMPEAALAAVPNAVVAPVAEIGSIIGEMTKHSLEMEGHVAMAADTSNGGDNPGPGTGQGGKHGPPSSFTCPECHGTLFWVDEENYERFRCRVGHGFSVDSLMASQSSALEAALWAAVRALEERNDLLDRMADRSRLSGQHGAADRFEERVRDGIRNINLLREVLVSGETGRDEAS